MLHNLPKEIQSVCNAFIWVFYLCLGLGGDVFYCCEGIM
jgi:hypothetical protein